MHSAGSDEARVNVEARGGGGEARILFGPGFFGGVLIFSVVLCLGMGAGGGC